MKFYKDIFSIFYIKAKSPSFRISRDVSYFIVHLQPVVNAAFAPDGSAIAVAYLSGIVKFFLVDLEGESSETE